MRDKPHEFIIRPKGPRFMISYDYNLPPTSKEAEAPTPKSLNDKEVIDNPLASTTTIEDSTD